MRGIQHRRYVLPAIQREFIWKPEKICSLFDSLMRGYPIGSFLFSRLGTDSQAAYAFPHAPPPELVSCNSIGSRGAATS